MWGRRIAIALLILSTAIPARSQVIDTFAGWNGSDNFERFGLPNTATYGQTFIAPGSNAKLQRIQFSLSDLFDGFNYLWFRFYVATWDGSKAGTVLFASPDFKADGSSTFQSLVADVGGLPIDPGQTYVWFLSESEFALMPWAQGKVAARFDNPYVDGTFVHFNNGSEFDRVTNESWDWQGDEIGDLAFVAEFTVPEPGALQLMVFGLLLMASGRAQRSRPSGRVEQASNRRLGIL